MYSSGDTIDAGSEATVHDSGSDELAFSNSSDRISDRDASGQLSELTKHTLEAYCFMNEALMNAPASLLDLARDRFMSVGLEYDGALFQLSDDALAAAFEEEIADAWIYAMEICRRKKEKPDG